MGDVLRNAAIWLERMRTTHATTPITYRTADFDLEAVPATVGKTDFQVEGRSEVWQQFEARDFLLLAADLVHGGEFVEPQAGHQIIEADGTTFEVMAPAGEPVWQWSDPYRQTARIHTKLVEA